MSTSDSGLRDDVEVAFNDMTEDSYTKRAGAVMQQPEPIPDRPADGAPKAKWVDYVVALGADRDFVTGQSEHHDPGAEVTRTVRVPVSQRADADVDYYEDLGSVIDAGIDADESPEDFGARMRSLYERAREQVGQEPEYREETRTEYGGPVQSKALSRDALIELADRLGG